MAKEQRPNNRGLLANWIRGSRNWPKNELILIAHRGNIDGRVEDKENTPAYLTAALKAGYNVSCDVGMLHGAFVLPALGGYHRLPYAFLSNPRMWFRTADPITLDALCAANAHAVPASADVTLTSVHYLWCMPDTVLTPRSIAVFPEAASANWLVSAEPAGLCSNEISRYV